MSMPKYDNQSLPGGELDLQRRKRPKARKVPTRDAPYGPGGRRTKPTLGKEPAAPKPRRR